MKATLQVVAVAFCLMSGVSCSHRTSGVISTQNYSVPVFVGAYYRVSLQGSGYKNAHLRQGAGTNHRSLGLIDDGQIVKVTGPFVLNDSTQWLPVNLSKGGNQIHGYMAAKYLQVVGSGARSSSQSSGSTNVSSGANAGSVKRIGAAELYNRSVQEEDGVPKKAFSALTKSEQQKWKERAEWLAEEAVQEGAGWVAEKMVGKPGGPMVDVMWPTTVGGDPAFEDPDSAEYKERQAKLEAEAKAKAEAERQKAERDAAEKRAREKELQMERAGREIQRELKEQKERFKAEGENYRTPAGRF